MASGEWVWFLLNFNHSAKYYGEWGVASGEWVWFPSH